MSQPANRNEFPFLIHPMLHASQSPGVAKNKHLTIFTLEGKMDKNQCGHARGEMSTNPVLVPLHFVTIMQSAAYVTYLLVTQMFGPILSS